MFGVKCLPVDTGTYAADGSVGQMISSYTRAIVIGFVLMMTGIVDRTKRTEHRRLRKLGRSTGLGCRLPAGG